MALQPSTITQVAEKSILDIFGRQTYLGNTFALPMPGGSLTDATQTPIVTIRNPSTATKSLFLFQPALSVDANSATVRYYKNPTINVAGSATTPVNLRFGSTLTSGAQCYLGATITSNGTLLEAVPAIGGTGCSNLLCIIDPGTILLMTAQQPTVTTTTVFISVAWYEI